MTPAPDPSDSATTLTPDAFTALGGGGAQTTAPAGDGATPGTMSPDDFTALKSAADKPLQLKPGEVTGWVPNLLAAPAQGVAGAINVVGSDPFANLIGYPVASLAILAHDKIGPWFGAKPFTPEDRAKLMEDFGMQSGNVDVTTAAHALGLPAPEQVVPTPGTGQAEVRAAIAAGTGMALLGGGGKSTVAQAETRAANATAAGITPGRVAATGGAGIVTPAVVGTAAGAGGAIAADLVPPEYKDVASVAGQLIAGSVASVGAGMVQTGARVAQGAYRSVIPGAPKPVINPATGEQFTAQPTTAFSHDPVPGGQVVVPPGEPIAASPYQQAAAGRLITKAGGGGPGEVTANVPETPAPGVGESTGTLGQQTGNLGLIAKERALENTPYGRTAFQAKRAVDNLTRVQSLQDAAPGDVSSAAGEWMSAQLARERALEESEVSTARQAADTATETAAPGGGPGVQEIGAAQRDALGALRQPVKEAAQAAERAIDPDGKLALDTTGVADRQRAIMDDLGKGGKLTSAEETVMDAARDMRGVNKFSDLRSLKQNVGAALREIRRDPKYGADSQPYRRMSILMDSIQGSMTDAASRAAEGDITAGTPVGQRFIDRAAEMTGGGTPTGAAGGEVGANAAPGGRVPPAGGPGAETPPLGEGVGPGARPGDSGVAAKPAAPVEPLYENFDAKNAAQVRASNRQYADYVTRFRTGAVGDTLASGAGPGGFRIGDAMVPGKLFRPGPAGAEAADSLIKATGSVEKAQEVIGDDVVRMLRNKVMSSGTWNDRAFQQFKNAYAPALAKFPELAQKFETAAQAQEAVETAAIRGRQRVEDFENSAARVYLTKEGAPVDNMTAIDQLVRQPNTGAAARDLMARAAPNRAAVAGIQRNVLEWLTQRATTTAEAGVSGVKELSGAIFQRTVNNPKIAAVLDAVLSPDQLKVVRDNAADLARAARAWNAVKVPGSPGTAADLAAASGHGGQMSQFLHSWLGERLMHTVHAVGGGLITGDFSGALLGMLASARRAAGLDSIERLMIEGQLNPQLGRVLEQAAAKNPRAPAWRDTARRIVMLGGVIGGSSQDAGKR